MDSQGVNPVAGNSGVRDAWFCRTMVWAMLACMTEIGCSRAGDRYDRLPIAGTVTLDGQPLAEGYLILEPKEGQPTQSGGMIHQGRFAVPQKSGPVAGKYSVAIFSGAESLPATAAPGTPEAELAAKKAAGERIPRKYNIDTMLVAEVIPNQDNTFVFELTSK